MRTEFDFALAEAFLKLLGAPKNCRSIELRMTVNEIATVTAEYFPDIDGDPPVFEEYELRRKDTPA